MRLTAALLLLSVAGPAGDAAAQRARSTPRNAPAAVRSSARFRCWSERPQDCAAAAGLLLRTGTLRPGTRSPASGWSQDLEISFPRESAIAEAARTLSQFVDDLRLQRFSARLSFQGPRKEWKYATETPARGLVATTAARSAQSSGGRIKERTRDGDLELTLAGKGGKAFKGMDRQVDGILYNRGDRPLTVQLARACDLDVAVAERGTDRVVALSPCANAPATLHLAPQDSFVFHGAQLPSDGTGSYAVYATLSARANGAPVQLRSKSLRFDFKGAGKSEPPKWARQRDGCVPTPLGRRAHDELAGSYMIRLAKGVDAEALARYLAAERKLRVTVSTPRYLNLRGSEADATSLACLSGVDQVMRDVENKKE